ncbi:MAG: glycine cleavage system aminomethyltransferase GcvT [Candidatus Korarchaeum sp.]|nr:glycine cleavage system aminomethyltransferase GcvT [Candidatus Korarchaeum sp.]MDW8036369.1 glycine cleavage system aminomethyltransferase GcvT [Candidatus Korarchaeum sp.]
MLKLGLRDLHEELGAKFFEFAGWEMPMKYTNSLEEALSVRKSSGVFDVSHMGRLRLEGSEVTKFLQMATSNNVDVDIGRSRYTLTLNERGGIKDDNVAFRLSRDEYLFVVNASNRVKILDWFNELVRRWNLEVRIEDITFDSFMLAIQGPKAREIFHKIINFPINIKKFNLTKITWKGDEVIVSRTGYTGEDGYEVILSDQELAAELLTSLVREGVKPCGLVARDILRLEAGLVLYGNDIDENKSPIEAKLEFTVDLGKDYFVGREAILEIMSKDVKSVRVGLLSESRNAPRRGEVVYAGKDKVGSVTSGTFSPTVERGIGMAYVLKEYADLGRELQVGEERKLKVSVSKMPFYDESIYGWRRATLTSLGQHG